MAWYTASETIRVTVLDTLVVARLASSGRICTAAVMTSVNKPTTTDSASARTSIRRSSRRRR